MCTNSEKVVLKIVVKFLLVLTYYWQRNTQLYVPIITVTKGFPHLCRIKETRRGGKLLDNRLVDIFIGEVERQSKFALLSLNGMNDYLTSDSVDKDIDAFWLFVQSFLVSSANISKLLWNTEKGAPNESKELRKRLNVDNDSKLRTRRFRNLFEHYDEHLVTWSKTSKRKSYATSNIFPRGAVDGLNSEDIFRTYYPNENVLVFKGEEYEIQPVLDEIGSLYNKCQEIRYR